MDRIAALRMGFPTLPDKDLWAMIEAQMLVEQARKFRVLSLIANNSQKWAKRKK